MSGTTELETIRAALQAGLRTADESTGALMLAGLVALGEIAEDTLEPYLTRQWDWSKRTFGPGKRTLGIIQHISKELREIEAKPNDLSEWVDVAILAMDGYWRHGGKPEQFMSDMLAKQEKNFARVWPTPTSEDEAVEHDRSFDTEPALVPMDQQPEGRP